MQYIQGISRNQLHLSSLEDKYLYAEEKENTKKPPKYRLQKKVTGSASWIY
ncbi:hypothetical protein [Flavobacterium columnare]|uniref:hypothetical protein n=1 Tax=Flavobacterium columnare TaxID=996 RepID=UPI001BC88026|nr:hypothetical protein [Flavobacterium columnare]